MSAPRQSPEDNVPSEGPLNHSYYKESLSGIIGVDTFPPLSPSVSLFTQHYVRFTRGLLE